MARTSRRSRRVILIVVLGLVLVLAVQIFFGPWVVSRTDTRTASPSFRPAANLGACPYSYQYISYIAYTYLWINSCLIQDWAASNPAASAYINAHVPNVPPASFYIAWAAANRPWLAQKDKSCGAPSPITNGLRFAIIFFWLSIDCYPGPPPPQLP